MFSIQSLAGIDKDIDNHLFQPLIIAFDHGQITIKFFREIICKNSNAGRLFEPGNAYDLSRSITSYLKISNQIRTESARKLAEDYAWSKVIQPVIGKMNMLGWC